MENSLIIFISFISSAFVSSFSPQSDVGFLHHSACFEKYLQEIIRINRNYEDSFWSCNDEKNINRRPSQQLDPQAEIEKHKQTSREACFDLTACNRITDSAGFFKCHSKNTDKNVNKLFIMLLNASSMTIELSDQYDQEEKEILRCHLAAKRKYFSNFSFLNKEHLTCLNAIGKSVMEFMLRK